MTSGRSEDLWRCYLAGVGGMGIGVAGDILVVRGHKDGLYVGFIDKKGSGDSEWGRVQSDSVQQASAARFAGDAVWEGGFAYRRGCGGGDAGVFTDGEFARGESEVHACGGEHGKDCDDSHPDGPRGFRAGRTRAGSSKDNARQVSFSASTSAIFASGCWIPSCTPTS